MIVVDAEGNAENSSKILDIKFSCCVNTYLKKDVKGFTGKYAQLYINISIQNCGSSGNVIPT